MSRHFLLFRGKDTMTSQKNDLSSGKQEDKEWLVSMLDYIVHDLINPLNFANGSLKFLEMAVQEEDTSKDIREAVNDTNIGIQRSISLVRQIKMISQSMSFDSQSVKVVDLFNGIGAFVDTKGCKIEFDKNSSDVVDMNKFAIEAILDNLSKNVFDHAKGATLKLSFKNGVFLVQDDGPGIPKDKLDLIFGDYSSKAGRPGGLGLKIARIFTDRLGGKLSVESEIGQGTCFTVDFSSKVNI